MRGKWKTIHPAHWLNPIATRVILYQMGFYSYESKSGSLLLNPKACGLGDGSASNLTWLEVCTPLVSNIFSWTFILQAYFISRIYHELWTQLLCYAWNIIIPFVVPFIVENIRRNVTDVVYANVFSIFWIENINPLAPPPSPPKTYREYSQYRKLRTFFIFKKWEFFLC